MFNLRDTIAAITTPQGTGGIAGIRISGADSWGIAKKIFETAKRRNGETAKEPFNHMHALHGYIKDNEKIIDEVVLIPFKSPKSFTSEDVIEIYCHGGKQIPLMILNLCFKYGARQAKAGEFTFRAFINGRIDLTEAEAINEIINAESDKAVFSASEILSGSLKDKLNKFKNKFLTLITSIESSIEFPMDVPDYQKSEVISELENINKELEELLQSSDDGQVLRNGVKVSIIGAPNVGKSSLLNQLLENQRAIVTGTPGTTRDTIEEKAVIEGLPFVFIDTAGIREDNYLSEPEKIGIERSKKAVSLSDILLFVFDVSAGIDKETEKIFKITEKKTKILVGNKIDLIENTKMTAEAACDIYISAKYGTNIELLKKQLVEKTKKVTQSSGLKAQYFYINQRQKELLLQSSSEINTATEMLEKNEPEDLIAEILKKALSKLDEVSGSKTNEEVIKNIFAKFCIGK